MIRSAATEALGFLMTRDDAALPQCASKPGTRSNSRPPSPGRQVMRPANVPVKPRPEHGLVIDDQYGMDAPVYVPKREKTPATTVYDDGTIPDIDENNDEDAKTSVSRGSRRTALSDRSGASSRARSTLSQRTSHSQRAGGEKHIEQSTSAGALIGRKGGGGGSLDGLEAVQEESRIGTAVSEATRKGMGTAETHLLEDAAALLECEQNDEDDDDFQVDWDDVMEELVSTLIVRLAFIRTGSDEFSSGTRFRSSARPSTARSRRSDVMHCWLCARAYAWASTAPCLLSARAFMTPTGCAEKQRCRCCASLLCPVTPSHSRSLSNCWRMIAGRCAMQRCSRWRRQRNLATRIFWKNSSR